MLRVWNVLSVFYINTYPKHTRSAFFIMHVWEKVNESQNTSKVAKDNRS